MPTFRTGRTGRTTILVRSSWSKTPRPLYAGLADVPWDTYRCLTGFGWSGTPASCTRRLADPSAPCSFIHRSNHTYAPKAATRRPVTAHMGRSGGTRPIRNVSPLLSRRETKTRRRRSRALARARASGPRNAVPLRGVMIQRPSSCRPVSANSSILRSKSSTLSTSEPPRRFRGRRKAAHTMPKAASVNQPTRPALRSRFPRPATTCTTCCSSSNASTHIWRAQSHACDSLEPSAARLGSARPIVAALAAGLLQQAKSVDARTPIEGLGRIVQTERRDGCGGERLHFDARPVAGGDPGLDPDATGRPFGFHDDLGSRHRDRMTERQEVRRALHAHDAGHAGGLEGVPLRRPRLEVRAGLRGHRDHAFGHGLSVRDLLASHLDDARRVPGRHQSSGARNTMTVTSLPAGAVSTPAGTMAKPFARATVAMRFEPRPPVGVATYPSSSGRTSTRANCVLPFGPETSAVRRAVISGRDRFVLPIIFRIAGRMNTSNETNTLTGFPGRPK